MNMEDMMRGHRQNTHQKRSGKTRGQRQRQRTYTFSFGGQQGSSF